MAKVSHTNDNDTDVKSYFFKNGPEEEKNLTTPYDWLEGNKYFN